MSKAAILGLLVLSGCATVDTGMYQPKTSKEKAAYADALRDVSPEQVRADFDAFRSKELAWGGVIKDIQFKETERTVQVAFQIEHRHFDWQVHGLRKPYRLSKTGEGTFVAGWTIQKPTRITRLKSQAKPGYMILVYGKPYQMRNSMIQLSASALRVIESDDFEIIPD